jgi:hypothetical protein
MRANQPHSRKRGRMQTLLTATHFYSRFPPLRKPQTEAGAAFFSAAPLRWPGRPSSC